MKLKNILIVVKDIEASKRFYKDLFGLDMIMNGDGNVILTEGLVLQEQQIWESYVNKEVVWRGHDTELYFEEKDIEGMQKKLDESSYEIEYINRASKHECGRRLIRIYDLDGHMIEIGEAI